MWFTETTSDGETVTTMDFTDGSDVDYHTFITQVSEELLDDGWEITN